jgi:hypothetical protein
MSLITMYVLGCLLWLAAMVPTTVAGSAGGVDAEEFPEFQNYMQAVQEKEHTDAEYADMMTEHEEWRQNTLMGRTVMGLQYVAAASNPFIRSVLNVVNNTDSSTVYGILLINLARIFLLAMAFLAVYLLGHVVKLILGEEIIVEERIIVIDEVTKSGKMVRSTELSEESEFMKEQQDRKKEQQNKAPRRGKKSKKED